MAQLLIVGEYDVGVIFEFGHANVIFHFSMVDFPCQRIPLRIFKLILLGLFFALLYRWYCLLPCFKVRFCSQEVHIALQG